jgi:acyl carrier protein
MDVQKKVISLLAKEAGHRVSAESSLAELNLDEADMFSVIMGLKLEYNIDFTYREFKKISPKGPMMLMDMYCSNEKCFTVREFVDYVSKKVKQVN